MNCISWSTAIIRSYSASVLVVFFWLIINSVHLSKAQTFGDITVEDGEPLVNRMASTQFSVISSNAGSVHSIAIHFNGVSVYQFTIINSDVTLPTSSSPPRFDYISPQPGDTIADTTKIKVTIAIKDIVMADNGLTTLQFQNSGGSASSNTLTFTVSGCPVITGATIVSSVDSSGECTNQTFNCTSTFTCNSDEGLTLVNEAENSRTCGKQAKWFLDVAENDSVCKSITCDASSLMQKFNNYTVVISGTTNNTYQYNEVATVDCKDNIYKPASTNCTCNETNTWTCKNETFECVKIEAEGGGCDRICIIIIVVVVVILVLIAILIITCCCCCCEEKIMKCSPYCKDLMECCCCPCCKDLKECCCCPCCEVLKKKCCPCCEVKTTPQNGNKTESSAASGGNKSEEVHLKQTDG